MTSNQNAFVVPSDNFLAVIDPSRDRIVESQRGTSAPLRPGEELRPGDARFSPSGAYALLLQRDGNLVLYRVADGKAVWATNALSQNLRVGDERVALQSDGNLVVYDDKKALWSSNTYGKKVSALLVGDNGELRLLGPDGAVWTANAGGVWTGPTRLHAGTLSPGAELRPGDALLAKDGVHALWYRDDGDLAVVRLSTGGVLSHSATSGRGVTRFQTDGNLVIYVPDGVGERPVWSTDTDKYSDRIEFNDDGSLRVLSKVNAVLWSSPGRTAVEGGLRSISGAGTVFGASEGSADPPKDLPAWLGAASAVPLLPGEELKAGQARVSPRGSFALVYQADGDLVLVRVVDKRVMWRSGTAGTSAGRATLQTDGNFVVYDAGKTARWSSKTDKKTATALLVGEGGEVRLLGPEGTLWKAEGTQTGKWDVPQRLRASPQTGPWSLAPGDALLAADGRHALWLRDDGLLCVVRLSSAGLSWMAGRWGKSAVFDGGGDLLVRDGNGVTLWSAGCGGKGGRRLEVTAAGVVRVLTDKGAELWASPTPTAAPGAAFRARLAEMAVSYARGLVIQACVYPTGDGTILELSNGNDRDVIALTARGTTLELRWHDTGGVLQTVSAPEVLTTQRWCRVAVVLASEGVSFYRDGVRVWASQDRRSLPAEVARARNSVGSGDSTDLRPFSGAIADLRLWNRALGPEAIAVGQLYQPLGHEAGLVGWWTLEGDAGLQDGSPFGRHGSLIGPRSAAPARYGVAPAQDRFALDFTEDRVEIEEFELTGSGFTWQARVLVRDLAKVTTLLRLTAPGAEVLVETENGGLKYKVTNQSGNRWYLYKGLIKAGAWVNLALRQAPDAKTTFFVDGKAIGTSAVMLLPPAGRYVGKVGEHLDGQLAELRLWSRELSDAEVLDTAGRRIHGWAPGLVGCWRMDERLLAGAGWLVNADPTGPRARAFGAKPAERGALTFGPPPKVPPPRAGLTRQEQLLLPILPETGGSGLSVQLWVNPDLLTGAHILKLGRSDQQPRILLNSCQDGALVVWVGRAKVFVDGVLTARRWAHVTVTIDAQGLMCLYKDGVLQARADLEAPERQAYDAATLGSFDFFGAFAEVRLWSRALSANEVEGNWRRRVRGGAGLVARWALAGDLSGTPGALVGAPVWREAPSLRVQDAAAPTPATVSTRASLLADQTGKRGKPTLCVDLTARDDRGMALPGTALTVVLEPPQGSSLSGLKLYRGSVAEANRVPLGTEARQTLTLTTGPQGSVRLVLEIDKLVAPILRVRHAQMGEGEWTLVAPDQAIHQALGTLTADELRTGRRATATTRAGSAGLVRDNADALAAMLSGMLSGAASFSFEEESTAALAFDGSEEAPPPTPLVPSSAGPLGANFVVAEDAPLVRRLGATRSVNLAEATPSAGDEDEGLSFGVSEWIGKGISIVATFAKTAVQQSLETLEDVGKAVLGQAAVDSVKLAINTVINGVRIVVDKVVSTVEAMVDVVVDVFRQLGKALSEVLDFLASLFDWGDILETTEMMLSAATGAIDDAKTAVQKLSDMGEAKIRELETWALEKLGGKAPDALASAREESETTSEPEPMGILDYLIALLPDDFGAMIHDLVHLFDPLEQAASRAIARLPGLFDGVAAEWQSGSIKEALKDPRRLIDGDPSEWLELGRMFVRIIANAAVQAVEVAADLVCAVLDVFRNVLNFHVAIPGLTDFVKTTVLRGEEVTLGRLLCLFAAIPTTILYKLATGSKTGPAALAEGVVSFDAGDTGGGDVSAFVRGIIARGFDFMSSFVGWILDIIESGAEDALKKIKGWVVFGFVIDGLSILTAGINLIWDWKKDWKVEGHGFTFILDRIGWLMGGLGWGCKGLTLGSTKREWAEKADSGLGIASDVAGFISGLVGSVQACLDDSETKGTRAVAILDTVAALGGAVSGIACAVEGVDPVKTIVIAVAGGAKFACTSAALVVFCATGPT